VASRTFAQKPRLEIEESEEYNAVIAKVASEEKQTQPVAEKHGTLWTLRNLSYILCSMVVLFAFLWVLRWPLKWGINVLKRGLTCNFVVFVPFETNKCAILVKNI
jgi:hypothetical protein